MGSKRQLLKQVRYFICLVLIIAGCSIYCRLRKKYAKVEVPPVVTQVETTTQFIGRKYKPEWADLISRNLPGWFDQAKIGIHIQWGLYSVAGCGPNAEWLKHKLEQEGQWDMDCPAVFNAFKPGIQYQEFSSMFTAEMFDAEEWANIFAASGAKYVILTSNHFDRFSLFPSIFGSNSVSVGPRRDIVAEIGEAMRKIGLNFGIYYAVYDWLYHDVELGGGVHRKYSNELIFEELKQLVQKYVPDIVCTHTQPDLPKDSWNETNFLAWLYTYSSVRDFVVAGRRFDDYTTEYHGEFSFSKNFGPGYSRENFMYGSQKYEGFVNIDRSSWGHRRNIDLYALRTTKQLLREVVFTISRGDNALIFIGPTREGTIPVIFQQRLLELGKWLELYGEAIYGSVPWLQHDDTINANIMYTCSVARPQKENSTDVPKDVDSTTAIYVIFFKWPSNNVLRMRDIAFLLQNDTHHIEFLTQKSKYLKMNRVRKGVYKEVEIQLPNKSTVDNDYAWVLKLTLKTNKEEKYEDTTTNTAVNVLEAKKVPSFKHSNFNANKTDNSLENFSVLNAIKGKRISVNTYVSVNNMTYELQNITNNASDISPVRSVSKVEKGSSVNDKNISLDYSTDVVIHNRTISTNITDLTGVNAVADNIPSLNKTDISVKNYTAMNSQISFSETSTVSSSSKNENTSSMNDKTVSHDHSTDSFIQNKTKSTSITDLTAVNAVEANNIPSLNKTDFSLKKTFGIVENYTAMNSVSFPEISTVRSFLKVENASSMNDKNISLDHLTDYNIQNITESTIITDLNVVNAVEADNIPSLNKTDFSLKKTFGIVENYTAMNSVSFPEISTVRSFLKVENASSMNDKNISLDHLTDYNIQKITESTIITDLNVVNAVEADNIPSLNKTDFSVKNYTAMNSEVSFFNNTNASVSDNNSEIQNISVSNENLSTVN